MVTRDVKWRILVKAQYAKMLMKTYLRVLVVFLWLEMPPAGLQQSSSDSASSKQ